MKRQGTMYGWLLVLAGFLVLRAVPVAAQTTYTWTGAAADDDAWNTPGNWDGDAAPPRDKDSHILFDSAAGPASVVDARLAIS